MSVSKSCYILFLSALFACSSEQNQPNPVSETDTIDQHAEIAKAQDNTPFTRISSSMGQTIYVPVYSHIYQLNQQKTFNLTATLSFRNADLKRDLTLTKVHYYDSEGNLVKNYLESPRTIKPLASTSFVVEENDLRGGVGANFIVSWESPDPAYPPVVEAVMISTSQQQGISFISVGRVLQENSQESTPDE